jgi:hypothetical protein
MDALEELGEPEEAPEEPVRLLAGLPSTSYGDLIVRYPYQRASDYAFAYHEAAKRLASTFRGKPEDDTMLLPFLLLYRHAYELRLKHLITYLAATRRRYRRDPDPRIEPQAVAKRLRYDYRHRLEPLLNEFLEHFTALDLPHALPDGVASTIMLLHEADSTGMSFRYAELLPNTQEHTNFVALAELLNEQLMTLSITEDVVEERFANVPDDFVY